jgi:hypothetical protein
MALAVTACGEPLQGELSPKYAAAPKWPYGLVVGVATVARTPSTPPLATRTIDIYLTYHQQNGPAGELILAVRNFRRPEVYEGVEDGLPVAYRPFVLKLPAGRDEFFSFATRRIVTKDRQEQQYVSESYRDNQGKWQSRSVLKTVTVTDYIPVVSSSPLPSTTFEVVPGKVHYIGRVGALIHADRQIGPGQPACPFGGLEDIAAPMPRHCVAREPFLEIKPEADLAMIRQHFPKLADVDIEIRPVETTAGSWQTLPDAARRYGAKP